MRPHQFLLLIVFALFAFNAQWFPRLGGSGALLCAGLALIDSTRFTRGPGSWKEDKVLTILGGVCWGAALGLIFS